MFVFFQACTPPYAALAPSVPSSMPTAAAVAAAAVTAKITAMDAVGVMDFFFEGRWKWNFFLIVLAL